RTRRRSKKKKANKKIEKKEEPPLEETKENVDENVEEARKKLEEEMFGNGSDKKSGFNIPLKKVENKEIVEGVKQQLAEEETSPEEKQSVRPATEEEIKESVSESDGEQGDKFKFVNTGEDLTKG